MKDKLRFLMKKKQSFIALFVLLIMVFNACGSPGGGGSVGGITGGKTKTNDFTPVSFYVDSSGNITDTDSGRTGLVADDKAYVIFYSDDIDSSYGRVGFAFEDKKIIFFFENGKNYPTSMVMTDSEGSYNGYFTPYDTDTQTFGLWIEQEGETETLPGIALSKETFTQYKNDTGLTISQNLRMRNMYIAMFMYKSIYDFIDKDAAYSSARWNFLKWVGKQFKKFVIEPVVKVVNTAVEIFKDPVVQVVSSLLNPLETIINTVIQEILGGIDLIGNNITNAADGTVSVIGVSLNKTTASIVVGASETFTATVMPSNAANKTVTWSSSNTAVAAVSNGTVTGVNVGTATITATTADGGKKATCAVTITLPQVPVSRIEYYWVNEHGNLTTTSGNTVVINAGATLTITAQSADYVVKQWHLNGIDTGQSGTTYNFSSAAAGNHTVGLFVEKDSKLYNTNIAIMVK